MKLFQAWSMAVGVAGLTAMDQASRYRISNATKSCFETHSFERKKGD